MIVKLGKIVYLITQHVHSKFQIPTSFISQNIPVEMVFVMKKWTKIHIILVCKILIYRAMDLKLGMLVYIITQHILVHFQVPIAWNYENMADFVNFYNKNCQKLSTFWSVKYIFWKPMVSNCQRMFISIRCNSEYRFYLQYQKYVFGRPV